MKAKIGNKIALFIEITLTLFIIGMMISTSFDNVRQEVKQYQSGLQSDYERLIAAYTTDFKMMVNDISGEIEKNVSFDEMQQFLQSKDALYENAIGPDIYDGISLTYKGSYARSWNYGDYSDYDPNTRPWYQTAQAADGAIALTAPYVTFLTESELSTNDECIILTLTQKYNDEISFCYDIKTFAVNDLLSKRYNRYPGTFALMYDSTGYVLSSTRSEYYCHNVYQADDIVTQDLVNAVNTGEKTQDKIRLVWANHKFQFSYCTMDSSGDYYSVVIPFWSVAKKAFLGSFLIALFLIGLEIWIYYRTEKQRQIELELERIKNVSQMKQDFLARMSHDMRTPMNGILGISELSTEEDDVSVLKENMTKIHSSGIYLLGLINDSLDLQKIESGKLVLNPTIVSTHELIGTSADMIKLSAKKKNIQFDIVNKNADMHGYIKVDVMRMRQIFVNLLSNAIKFTPDGGKIQLTIEVLGRDGSTAHDRLTVSDNGIGMSPDFIENHLFKPFSQEHNALTDNTPGTGLGLSIVKKIVDLMGASITVESELGKGTKFIVDIDFEIVDTPSKSPDTPGAPPQTDCNLEILRGKHILLAEDHPLNAEIATKILEKAGCMVTWVKDGKECVENFKASKDSAYDLILMDIRMPELDGLEATHLLRRLNRPDAVSIPIIAMSANAYEEDVTKSMQAGMNAHLSKPIDPSTLYGSLCKYLSE